MLAHLTKFLPNHTILSYILYWVVSAISLICTAYLVKDFKVGNFWSALITAIMIGFADTFLRPFLLFITLPINILTLGLFTFVINGMVLKICAAFLPKFEIKTWGAAIFGALVLAVINTVLHLVIG